MYRCVCCNIEVVDCVKYLGLYIDKRLKWDHHINLLSKKLRKANHVIYHLRHFVRSEQLKNVYLSWFESLLRFGIIHYGGTYSTILKPIVMNQRHALRNMHSLKRMDRMSYLFSENNILTFNQLHQYSIIMFVVCTHTVTNTGTVCVCVSGWKTC